MPIDVSAPPPKCPHCILGKQTRSSVPKVREGIKATVQLERVYVDLCGPMSICSRSGRLYSMNLIDDFSGYVWSLPLRSKDEAADVLQSWLTFLELQTPFRLKSFVTDNGELASNRIHDWCTQKGTVEPLVTHTPRWTTQGMGYRGLWLWRSVPENNNNKIIKFHAF